MALILLASSLNSFKKLQHEITKEFESLSEIVLKSYLPENSKVYGFGSNTKYTGNAQSKIIQLSKDINVDIDMRIIKKKVLILLVGCLLRIIIQIQLLFLDNVLVVKTGLENK